MKKQHQNTLLLDLVNRTYKRTANPSCVKYQKSLIARHQ
jgi:hypothetical protein